MAVRPSIARFHQSPEWNNGTICISSWCAHLGFTTHSTHIPVFLQFQHAHSSFSTNARTNSTLAQKYRRAQSHHGLALRETKSGCKHSSNDSGVQLITRTVGRHFTCPRIHIWRQKASQGGQPNGSLQPKWRILEQVHLQVNKWVFEFKICDTPPASSL